MSRKRVTIATIADEAGVSVPTVSKVINGRPEVAPETRHKVEALLHKHGYQRRVSQESMPTGLVDLVFTELESPWAMEIIRGAEIAAREASASVVISVVHTHAGPGRDWLERLAARRTDGVVIVASKLSPHVQAQLTARSLPFVVVDPEGDPPPVAVSVGATNWHGGLAATRHLLELGHTRIGMISGPPDMLCSQARIDGYRAALEAAGLTVDPDLIRRGTFLVDSGHDNGHAMLDLPDPPTAIFAGSDLQAFGVLEAARQRGLRIPQDLSVVGFDDLPLSRSAWPPLTTVRQPLEEMAALATRTVLGMGHGDTPESRRVELATELVVRESTAPPRS
ncbi:LacI family DNA-binding transcriptional regulator [Nonomuraea sp. NPDC050556]|uniref:LacI family DNA-binding transcriptional regulator n=1 Tax=Nonomuraea sp. NPDC050556 TaxID=3364369 RepID=UPI00379CFBB8